MHLSAVAHLDLGTEGHIFAGDAVGLEVGERGGAKLLVDPVEPLEVERRDHRIADLLHRDDVCPCDPEGREHRCERRDHNRLGTDIDAIGADMERAGAAEREQREVPRVIASADRLAPDQVGHARVDDLDDSDRDLLHGQPQGTAEPITDRAVGRVTVKRPLATEEGVGVDPSEHDVRVGHGRFVPPLP